MFPLTERLIYKYFDGERDRLADPLVIEGVYLDALSPLNVKGLNRQLADSKQIVRVMAAAKFLPAIRQAFEVKEYDRATRKGLPLADTHNLTRRFFAWKDQIRQKYRTDARAIAVYGFPPGRTVPYEFYVGLTWNIEMALAMRGSVQTARGIATALGGSLHPSLIDAMANRISQFESVADAIASEQMEAEELAKISAGKL